MDGVLSLFFYTQRFSSHLQWTEVFFSFPMDEAMTLFFNGRRYSFFLQWMETCLYIFLSVFLSSLMGFVSLTQWMEFIVRGGFSFSMDGVSVSFTKYRGLQYIDVFLYSSMYKALPLFLMEVLFLLRWTSFDSLFQWTKFVLFSIMNVRGDFQS